MNLNVKISGIKSISYCEFNLPIEKGIYCLVGANGCGKSTVLSCIAQTVFSSSLQKLNEYDYTDKSIIEFSYGNQDTIWTHKDKKWITNCYPKDRIRFNGMYEGSLFYGTRFEDSLFVDEIVKNSSISLCDIVDADDYVKDQMSFILNGDYNHFRDLKRVRNKKIAEAVNLRNTPYFQVVNGHLLSQYRMSSGECLLVSLLHFIYNALIRKSLPIDQPILMLIDEIELALHPVAVARLIDLLNNIIEEHDNLTVLLTSHSPEVIYKISPNNLFMMEIDENNHIQINSPCYPSYAIRDVYMHDGFDFVILVEDLLAKYVVEKEIHKLEASIGKLINVLPIGGWENVLKFQLNAYDTNTFGIGCKVFSILDGDIQAEAEKKKYRSLPKLFLPINSIEKYLYKICTNSKYKSVKKEVNDLFFNVESIDYILVQYNFNRDICQKRKDDDGKDLYRDLLHSLEKRRISEEAFIKGLCDIIIKYNNFSSFDAALTSMLNR